MTKFAKVEGHTSLIRDMTSHAILPTNDAEFMSYKKRREAELGRQKAIDSQLKEIDSLKGEMMEIKQMLNQLLKNKGQ